MINEKKEKEREEILHIVEGAKAHVKNALEKLGKAETMKWKSYKMIEGMATDFEHLKKNFKGTLDTAQIESINRVVKGLIDAEVNLKVWGDLFNADVFLRAVEDELEKLTER